MINSNNDTRNDLEDSEDPLGPAGSNGGHRVPNLGFDNYEVQFPYLVEIGTSFILLIAVMMWEGDAMDSYPYAIAVPILSLIISLSCLMLTIFMNTIYALYGKHVAKLLFIWNFAGASFLTFGSPFVTTGNGYFAAWGCVVASAMCMGFTGDGFRMQFDGLGSLGSQLGMCASSAIMVVALIDYVGKKGEDQWASIFAMIVSIFTIIFVGGMMYYQKKNGNQDDNTPFVRGKFGCLAFFSILWSVVACLVTFGGPFVTTGNGYFASWAGVTCAWFAAFASWRELGITTEQVVGFLTPGGSPTGLSSTIS